MKSNIEVAASFIKNSDVILIGAGAGIGCDSGLPNFRGNEGFWNNYPPYKGLFNFDDCANPNFLEKEPNLFWGFYGSRLEMYRKAQPHKGFEIMLNYHQKEKKELFVLTSNVDGQFQKAGYPQDLIYQIHGSIHHLQCDKCLQITDNWFEPKVNYQKMSCQVLPQCKKCNQITRPNVLMFNDYSWISQRTDAQHEKYRKFLKAVKEGGKSMCMIEIGAGTAIPTIRSILENNYYHQKKSKYIKINPDKEDNSDFPIERFVHLEMGSLSALTQIQDCIDKMI